MKSILLHSIISIGLGFILSKIQELLGSNYITTFLQNNLITIQIALIAINATTLSVVLTKVRELIDKSDNPEIFKNTKREMLFSIKEQLVLVGISLLVLVFDSSSLITNNPSLTELFSVLLIGCFSYSVSILYDTSKSVFILIDIPKQ